VTGARPESANADLAAALPLDRVRAAQAGLVADLDQIADAVYGREATPEVPS